MKDDLRDAGGCLVWFFALGIMAALYAFFASHGSAIADALLRALGA